MYRTLVGLCALLTAVTAAPAAPGATPNPKAHVRNGTYVGAKNAHYQQDLFLGIPYAQQPMDDLRFTVPKSLNESWEDERDAKEYSDICVGYGVSSSCRETTWTRWWSLV